MDHLIDREFEQATIFESGYLMGYRQSEIKDLLFGVASDEWGHQRFAAEFEYRGKRKKQVKSVEGMVIINGWGHPKLETTIVERTSSGLVVEKAKYTAFSEKWDALLDEYLREVDSEIIVDARAENRPLDASTSNTTPGHDEPRKRIEPTEIWRSDDEAASETLREGAAMEVLLNRYERNPKARRECLAYHGYTCSACEVDMGSVYGELGRNYIHVHHKVPLSEIGEDYEVDPINDLVPVCPNCHAMLHRPNDVLTIEELKAIIAANRR